MSTPKEDDLLWEELKSIYATNPTTPELVARAYEIRDRLHELGHGTNDGRGWARWLGPIINHCPKDIA